MWANVPSSSLTQCTTLADGLSVGLFIFLYLYKPFVLPELKWVHYTLCTTTWFEIMVWFGFILVTLLCYILRVSCLLLLLLCLSNWQMTDRCSTLIVPILSQWASNVWQGISQEDRDKIYAEISLDTNLHGQKDIVIIYEDITSRWRESTSHWLHP